MANFPTTWPLKSTDIISSHPDFFNAVIRAVASMFWGLDEPLETFPGQFWANTTTGQLLLRNENNDGWIVQGELALPHGGTLPLSGGTMSGSLDMGGQTITNLGAASGAGAARVSDLDPLVRKDGTTPFTARQSHPFDPVAADDLARRSWIESQAKVGGTFSGIISVPFPPTDPDHVTRKNYVDNIIATHEASAGTHSPAVLDSGAQAFGSPLVADGAGGMSFGLATGYAAPITQEFTSAIPQGFVLQTSAAPAGSRWVVLQVAISAGSGIRFQVPLVANTVHEYNANIDPVDLQVIVHLDSLGRYEWRSIGNGVVSANLVGWLGF